MCKVLEISILESEHKKTKTIHKPIVESEPKTASGDNDQSVAVSLNPIEKLNVQASPDLETATSENINEGAAAAASAESHAEDAETRFVVDKGNLKLESLKTEIKKAMHRKIKFVLVSQFLYLCFDKVSRLNQLIKTKLYC